jgi:hypothetical protein
MNGKDKNDSKAIFQMINGSNALIQMVHSPIRNHAKRKDAKKLIMNPEIKVV